MENNVFLVFLFAVSIGILFVGSGITGLYSIDVDDIIYCTDEGDCDSGKICCAFQEGDSVSRICANDCRGVKGLSQEINYNKHTTNGFVLDITGSGVQDVKKNSDYWIYILIGVVLILLAFFYKKNPEKLVIKKRVIKTKKIKRRKKRKKR